MATSFTGAYFSDSVSVSGNTFEAGSWGGGNPPPGPGEVGISEFVYDAVGADTGFEWVELYNRGSSLIDLTGYDLYAGHYFTFPSFSLNAGQFVVVHMKGTGVDSATDLYENSTSGTDMNNTYGNLALFKNSTHDSANIVDYVAYGVGTHALEGTAVSASIWANGDLFPDVPAGHSIELKDPNIDTNQSGDWRNQATPSLGSWTP